jgi:hypothetical protein
VGSFSTVAAVGRFRLPEKPPPSVYNLTLVVQ